MIRMYPRFDVSHVSRRLATGAIVIASIISVGCTTNYLTNSTEGTYGVPVTERTIPQRLLDRSIEHTAKINIYGLQENLQQNSRMDIDSFNSEVLLTGEVPNEALKAEIEKVVRSMPDVRQVYNELVVSAARGYSSTVQDGYITSKLLAKIATSDSVKTSQIKAVTNNGIVYIMGRLTPTQQSHLIDIANDTVGITELVLLTTIVNDSGAVIGNEDIMSEGNIAQVSAPLAEVAQPVVRQPTLSTQPPRVNQAQATQEAPKPTVIDQTPIVSQPLLNDNVPVEPAPAAQGSSSPYIDLYRDQ